MSRENKRRIPYQWRLFLPLAFVLWTLLLGVAAWQVYRNNKYKETFVERQLKLVNAHISNALKDDDWKGIEKYKSYITEYFRTDVVFDDIRMTIYDPYWDPIDSIGRTIRIYPEERQNINLELFERESALKTGDSSKVSRGYYLITPVWVHGDRFTVVSSLPNDDVLEDFVVGKIRHIWLIIFLIALAMSILAFIAVKHLAKNINLLKDFAERSANDPNFKPVDAFAHDELGDIAHKIVQMYNDRAVAREQTEREHQMTIHTIEEKARQKRQLTNNINHELKTPIGVIKGYLDTIADSPEMDDATRNHFINKARDHANRLVNLVNDVSAITRLEDGEGQIGTEQLDFHEIVYVFSNEAREAGILGHFNMDVDIPLATYINGNGNLLAAMLMNLTKNAVNYSGGTNITVEYRGEDANNYHFAFYDNGNGVPEASLEHLFDRFYRIDSGRARKSGGTGLGLAIVFNTVKAHGGTIDVRNRPEGGLEFEFTLRKWHI